MAGHVGQGFLEDPEGGGAHGRRDLLRQAADLDLAGLAGARGEALRLLIEGRRKPQLVERRRPEVGRDPADHRGEVVDLFLRFHQPINERVDLAFFAPFQPVLDPAEVHLDAGQRLAELIVKFPGDAGAIRLAQRLHAGREVPEHRVHFGKERPLLAFRLPPAPVGAAQHEEEDDPGGDDEIDAFAGLQGNRAAGKHVIQQAVRGDHPQAAAHHVGQREPQFRSWHDIGPDSFRRREGGGRGRFFFDRRRHLFHCLRR